MADTDQMPDRVFGNESKGLRNLRASDSAHQQITEVKVDLGAQTLLVVCVMTVVIAGAAVIMGMNLARQKQLEDAFLKLDRQYRMTELKLDDWTVVAHRSGLVLPGDYTRGPQGDLDADSFNLPDRSK
jgi:hypothetical protein